MSMERPDILLAIFSLLQHSQSTTACVESFSVLRKLLGIDRNFKIENVNNMSFWILILACDGRVGCL